MLWRQVNAATPEAVVRNILKDSVPFFRFLYLKDSASTLSIDTVKAASLPLQFNATADTVRMRLIARSARGHRQLHRDERLERDQ